MGEGLNKEHPLILSCDLNTSRHSPSFKTFEKNNILKKDGLKSAYGLESEGWIDPERGTPITKLEGRYTASKWRRGGNQPEKCRPISETIDFIFYSNKHFTQSRTLSVPTNEEVSATSKLLLPCWRYPSDHFMIGADLEWS